MEEQVKIMDDEEREKKIAYEHEKNVAFELELLERKEKLQEEVDKSKQIEGKQPSKPISRAKLPKLPITKYNGKIEACLPFWGKFKSEIDSTDILDTYVVNIMSLPDVNGRDPVKINEFYKHLRYNVQSLDTLG